MDEQFDIRSHLRSGETIVSDHRPFFATSQRVVLFQNNHPRLLEIPYHRLSSIELVKEPYHKLMIAGTLMIIGGAILTTMIYIMSWLAIIVGSGSLVYGAIGRKSYYQLHADRMTDEEELLWRLPYWGSGSFIRTIRKIVGDRSDD